MNANSSFLVNSFLTSENVGFYGIAVSVSCRAAFRLLWYIIKIKKSTLESDYATSPCKQKWICLNFSFLQY